MIFAADLLPDWLNLLLAATMVLALGVAAALADWRAISAVPARLHLLFGCTGFCLLLWLMSIDIDGRVQIHLLGITAVTLILGLRFALLCASGALLLRVLLGDSGLAGLPGSWLCGIAVPALISKALIHRLARIRHQNLFMFTLGGGFGGGLLATLGTALSGLALLCVSGASDLVTAALANWPLLTLLMFPEGFINGMVLTAVCVFYPGLVRTFDDRAYIDEA